MSASQIESDIATLSQDHKRKPPDFPADEATVLVLLAEFLRGCDVGEYGALTVLMRCATERGLADPAESRWPVRLLTKAMREAYGPAWSQEKLRLILLEAAGMKLHTLPLDSPEIEFYESQQRKDHAIAAAVSSNDREVYERRKTRWRQLHVELDDLIVHREKTLVRREALRQSFLQKFPVYVEERDQRLRLAIAELKLTELEKDPTLQAEQLAALASKKLGEAAAELNADRRSLGYALMDGENHREGFSNAEDYQEYTKRLKVLYMLLHPDRLLHCPLTDNQRRDLRDLWDDCQAIDLKDATDHDLGRSAQLIDFCIERAQAILAQAGIDIDPGLVIQGDSFEERLSWLERAIPRQQSDIEILKDELKAWRDDKELGAMAALLNQPDDEQERQRTAMRERAVDYAKCADEIEQELNLRLTKGGRDESD